MNDDLLRMFAELNPVADRDRLATLGAPDLPVDPVLRALLEHGRTNGSIGSDSGGDAPFTTIKQRGGTPMTQQTQTTTRPARSSRSRGLAWAAAGAVAVVAVAAWYSGVFGADDEVVDAPPPGERLTDLEVLQAGVEALYSGDADRAVELFGIEGGDEQAERQVDDRIRSEAAYQAAIGGRLTLNCTQPLDTPGTFRCWVPYHNALADAVGHVDSPGDFFRAEVQDGVITQFGFPQVVEQVAHIFPEHSFILETVVSFLREEVEGSEGCWDDSGTGYAATRTADCARLIMDHLDAWADWYRTNG